jgi:hypothetical protein
VGLRRDWSPLWENPGPMPRRRDCSCRTTNITITIIIIIFLCERVPWSNPRRDHRGRRSIKFAPRAFGMWTHLPTTTTHCRYETRRTRTRRMTHNKNLPSDYEQGISKGLLEGMKNCGSCCQIQKNRETLSLIYCS